MQRQVHIHAVTYWKLDVWEAKFSWDLTDLEFKFPKDAIILIQSYSKNSKLVCLVGIRIRALEISVFAR